MRMLLHWRSSRGSFAGWMLAAFALWMLACTAHAQVLSGPSGVLPNGAHTASNPFLFYDETGSNYVGFQSPNSLTSGTKEILQLPPGDGSSTDNCWGWSSSAASGGVTTTTTAWMPCLLTTGGTMTGSILASGTPNLGSSSNAFNDAWITEGIFQTVAVSASGASFLIGIDTSTADLAITNALRTPILEFNSGGPEIISYSNLDPHATNTYNLGESSLYWNNAYINDLTVNSCVGCVASGVYLPLAGGTMTGSILASGGPSLGSSSNAFNDAWITEGTFQTVAVSASGASFLIGIDTSTADLAITNSARTPLFEFPSSGGAVSYQALYPSSNNAYDLGESSEYWENGYISTLYLTSAQLGTSGTLIDTSGVYHGGVSTSSTGTFGGELQSNATGLAINAGSGEINAGDAYYVSGSLQVINSSGEFVGSGGVDTSGVIESTYSGAAFYAPNGYMSAADGFYTTYSGSTAVNVPNGGGLFGAAVTLNGGAVAKSAIGATAYNIVNSSGAFLDGGVSCSGTPSSSFASVYGIVTHC